MGHYSLDEMSLHRMEHIFDIYIQRLGLIVRIFSEQELIQLFGLS